MQFSGRGGLGAAVSAFILLGVLGASSLAAQVSGAIFTTTSSGATNANIYSNKNYVYLNGGPRHLGAAGLPDGLYHCQVTAPNGVLLGSSIWRAKPTPVVVVNGSFQAVYRLKDIVNKASNHNVSGYDDTPNAGGEYKVWVSQGAGFVNSESKTDNFKVKKPNQVTPQTVIQVFKFYDANGNGVWDQPEEPAIPGWKIELHNGVTNALIDTQFTDGGGEVQWIVDQNNASYMVLEIMPPPVQPSYYNPAPPVWENTTPMCVVVIANQATREVRFGNVAKVFEPHFGLGRTKGFWHNENGRAMLAACEEQWWLGLNELGLVWPNGDPFVINATNSNDAHDQLAAWLVGVGAIGNPRYILGTQLAALWLNVHCGPMSELSNVYLIYGDYNGNVEGEFEEAADMIGDPEASSDDMLDLAVIFDEVNSNVRPVYEKVSSDVPPDFVY